MKKLKEPPSPRPYWHVDMKWLTSFPLIMVLGITFLVFSAYQITQPDFLTALLNTDSTLIPESFLSSLSNPQAHAFFGKILLYLSLISFLLLACLAFFSYRFGKISNIGCAFFVTALPGTVFFKFFKDVFSQETFDPGALPPSLPINIETLKLYSAAIREIGILILDFMYKTYLFITLLGLIVMFLALVSSIVWKIFKKK